MPILPQRNLDSPEALAAEFPVGVKPVRIADHDHQTILDHFLATGDRSERQILGLGQLFLNLHETL